MKKENKVKKPVIETMINTAALALTAAGTQQIIQTKEWFGFVIILFGAALEFFKYWGRKHKYW